MRPWTEKEDSYLRSAWRGGEPVERVAARLMRSPSAVRQRAAGIGVQRSAAALTDIRSRARGAAITAYHRRLICELVEKGETAAAVARRLGLSASAVRGIVRRRKA